MKKFILAAILFFACTLIELSLLPQHPVLAGPQKQITGPAIMQLPLPDLIVERIWLDTQCKINFKLKNQGTAKIPDDQYSRAQLKLFIGSTEVIYALAKPTASGLAVDPSGLLKAAGGTVSFNTGKILQEQRLVRAWVDHTHQIRESQTNNNTGRESLTPHCPAAPDMPAATSMKRPAATAATTAVPAGPTMVGLSKPTIQITSFRKVREGAGSMMMATTGGSGGSSLPDNTAYAAVGEEFELHWRIEGCHAAQVKTELRGQNPEGTLFTSYTGRITETRTNKVDDCFFINGSAKIIIHDDWDFILSVTALSPGAGIATAKSDKYHIWVKKPRLVVQKPEFKEDDMTVRFFIKNEGDADYPAPGADLRGNFKIGNWDGSRTFKSGTIIKDDLTLPKGAKVEIANMTLDREELGAYTKILCQAVADDEYYDFLTGASRTASKLFELETRSTTLDASILLAFFDSITGEIRLNNYQSPGADPSRSRPGVSRDSYVQIMGEENRVVFTPEFLRCQLKSKTTGNVLFDYRPFINNVTATIGGAGTCSIPEKNIVNMHIVVNTAGRAEIKGWKFVERENKYYDSEAPDVDITRLELDVQFHVNLRDGKLIIDGVWVKPTLNLVATQDFAWLLNMLTPRLERMASNEIAGYIMSLANSGDVKGQMNAKIAEALDLLNIDRILRFELTRSGLALTYIPGH